MDPQRIAEILTSLAAASTEDLQAAAAALRTSGAELAADATAENQVTRLTELADQHRQIREELASRTVRDGALNELAEVTDPVHDPAGDRIPQPDPQEGQPAEAGGTQPAGDPGAAAEGGQSSGQNGGQNGGDQGNAGTGETGARRLATLSTTPTAPAGQALVPRVSATTTFAGNIPGAVAGSPVTDESALTEAFIAKANALATAGGAPGRHEVVHVELAYPEERVLSPDVSEWVNMRRIQAVQSPDAIVAAGGLCQPLQVMYDIQTVGVTDRPIRDALVGFNVARGGIQYRQPFDALAMASGLGLWTQTMDRAVDPDDPATQKTCLAVDCPGTVTASIYSTYMCLEYANMTARFDPEWVQATNRSAAVAWARFAENQLLSLLLSGSKVVKGRQALSATRDILATYDKVISYYRSMHRLSDDIPLHTIAPRFLIDLMRTDMARGMNTGDPSPLFAIAKASLEEFFSTRNVNVTWHLDGLPGATVNAVVIPNQFYTSLAAGATVPGWPSSIDTVLYTEGDWLHLEGGTLDLGIVRDSVLNPRNRYQTFVETFEGVAFMGIESLRVVLPLIPNGASAGTVAPAVFD